MPAPGPWRRMGSWVYLVQCRGQVCVPRSRLSRPWEVSVYCQARERQAQVQRVNKVSDCTWMCGKVARGKNVSEA